MKETIAVTEEESERHVTVSTAGYDRVIIVGDVHGCLPELKALLQGIGYEARPPPAPPSPLSSFPSASPLVLSSSVSMDSSTLSRSSSPPSPPPPPPVAAAAEVEEEGEAATPQPTDLVVLAGDLVGKGPHSLQTLRWAMEQSFLCVRGNWERHALNILKAKLSDETSCPENSGKPKNKKKKKKEGMDFVDHLTRAEVKWLTGLPHTITLSDMNACVVHAGLVPGVPLTEQSSTDMEEMRSLIETEDISDSDSDADDDDGNGAGHGGDGCRCGGDGAKGGGGDGGESSAESQQGTDLNLNLTLTKRVKYVTSDEASDGVAWATLWPSSSPHVYFGHDAGRGLQICENATGLDTGCVKGRRLTACVLPVRTLYSIVAFETDPKALVEELPLSLAAVQWRKRKDDSGDSGEEGGGEREGGLR